jgi:sporulation protein YlmC with PRC-barrel domain
MANNDMDRVVPLGQLDDFKVAEGDPDVRGWEVMASDGRKIGEVDELLVDTNAMKVRYLDVDVDDSVMGDDRHVLIPIGYARLEQDHDRVMVDGLALADLGGLPSYDQGPLSRDFESSVRDSFSGRRTSPETTATAGMAGAGMLDTAGLDNTPGAGTGLGLGTNVAPGQPPTGEGMRAAGYDLEDTPRSGSELRDTGSPRTGLDPDLGGGAGLTASAAGAPVMGSPVLGAPVLGGGGGDHVNSAPALGDSDSTELGGTPRGSMSAGSDDTLVGGMSAGAGSQGPVSGMGTARAPQGDMSHQAGMPASDYQHNADEDFYASDAFDDSRFYGSRRGAGGGMGAGETETDRQAREGMERLREDQRNRDVGGTGL